MTNSSASLLTGKRFRCSCEKRNGGRSVLRSARASGTPASRQAADKLQDLQFEFAAVQAAGQRGVGRIVLPHDHSSSSLPVAVLVLAKPAWSQLHWIDEGIPNGIGQNPNDGRPVGTYRTIPSHGFDIAALIKRAHMRSPIAFGSSECLRDAGFGKHLLVLVVNNVGVAVLSSHLPGLSWTCSLSLTRQYARSTGRRQPYEGTRRQWRFAAAGDACNVPGGFRAAKPATQLTQLPHIT